MLPPPAVGTSTAAAGQARPVGCTRKHEADVPPAGLSPKDHTPVPPRWERGPFPASLGGAQPPSRGAVSCSGAPRPGRQALTFPCSSQTTWGHGCVCGGRGTWAPPRPRPPHSEAQLGGWHRRPSGSRGPSGSSQRARLYRGTHARSPQPGPENQPPSSRPWATHTRRRDVPEPAHAPRGRRQKTGRSRLPPPAASERD